MGINLSTLEINAEFVTTIVEFALALVLFSDGTLLELKLLRQSRMLPVQLLLIGLPVIMITHK